MNTRELIEEVTTWKMHYNNLEALKIAETYIENHPEQFSKTYLSLYRKALAQFIENKSDTMTRLNGPFYGMLMLTLMNVENYRNE